MYPSNSKHHLRVPMYVLTAFLAGFLTPRFWVEDRQAAISVARSDGATTTQPIAVQRVAPKKTAKVNQWETASLYEDNNAQFFKASTIAAVSKDSVADQLASIEDMLTSHDQSKQQRLFGELQKLVARVNTDPKARKMVLDRFLNSVGTVMGSLLSSILSASNDPAIEAAAISLAQNGYSTDQRVAALELLGQSQTQQQSTRDTLIDMLKNPSQVDEKVISAAMSALTRRGPVSQREQENVINTVKPYTESPNPVIREYGLKSLAEWAPSDNTVLQTVTAATQDADLSVRVSAVQSLGQNGFRFEDVRDTLVSRMQDQQENLQVRVAAWQTLESFPLDAQTYNTYATFKQAYPAQTQNMQ